MHDDGTPRTPVRRRLMLASASPRRRALLRQLGLAPEVHAVDIDETPRRGEAPRELVRRLATGKALAAPRPDAATVVLAADTVIDLDGRVLGKPRDGADARSLLLALANREHRVVSGVAVRRTLGGHGSSTGVASSASAITSTHTVTIVTRVVFGPVTEAQAARYAACEEPLDKAGGYAIQGYAARFVTRLDGSYSNVVGLPLHETARLLEAAGLALDPPARAPSS